MSKSFLCASMTLVACVLGACKAEHGATSTPHEAESAARYVIYEKARSRSSTLRSARQACSDACDSGGGEGWKLPSGYWASAGRRLPTRWLNLLALQLDAGMAEARSCQIAKRGKNIVPALERLNAAQAAAWCQSRFADLRKRELSNVADVTSAQICRPAAEVEADRQEWLAALQSGRDLFAESGPC